MSRWHRVSSDEVWHHLEGAPLELVIADPAFEAVDKVTIGAVRDGLKPEAVVAADHWQAARSTGAWTLVACVVGPGFDFDDFVMLRDRPEDASRLRDRHPALGTLI